MKTVSNITFIFIFTLAALSCSFEKWIVLAQRSQVLPEEEMNALREIAKQLRKKDWDFSLNPCDDGNSSWNMPQREDMPEFNNSVICNCSYPGGVCHIEKIFLKGQDLTGVLPPALSKLPYLKAIDFARNYLSGTIPPEWASTRLEFMSLSVNRLTGAIPKYLGNITTLLSIGLENNLFNGTVPAELGKLTNLEHLTLSANYLTGELPLSLSNLMKLTELRLSSNGFNGKMPSFRSWKNLQKLEMRASGFEGPLPSSISALKNLIDLRITNINGEASSFPMLKDMRNMQSLILSSCNISGKIPTYLSNMANLGILDLSFNMLHGNIPNLGSLSNLTIMYLTHNSLNGPIPQWVIRSRNNQYIDLSYNNFNESSVPSICQDNLNLFNSYRSRNISAFGKCLSSCTQVYHSFHVNCGGEDTTIGNTLFHGDGYASGWSKFLQHDRENWGVSSTGDFWYRNRSNSNYMTHNVSVLGVNNTELYMTARLSPLSLTYYGRCLADGNYTVTLHFAEIMFRDNQSYYRKTVFQYKQGEQKLKDFDIIKEANGVDMPVKKSYYVSISNSVLQIRFHYSGKGTAAVPSRGTYGPLISAISVESDFKPPAKNKKKFFAEIGASVSGSFVILAVIGLCWWNRYISRRISREKDLRGLDLHVGFFTFKQIKAATNNFDITNKIGEGGFGSVYKGTLLDHSVVAVKQLASRSKQGNREFVNEIGLISGLQHPNLLKLYGCCIEGNQLLLVYEYMKNNSLARAIFGPNELLLKIDWPIRQKICVGIAKGLTFMHEESTLKIVHRDIKANNILLDDDFNPKIADFGLAKLDEENTHISTRVAGTIGYMAPEYALWGHLTYKADVYSYGVVALEVVSGKNNMRFRHTENFVCLIDWALVLQKNGSIMDLVDPRLGSEFNKNEVEKIIRVALLCVSPSPALRPTMSQVVGMLQSDISIQEFNTDPCIYDSELKLQALREKYDEMYLDNQGEVQDLCSNPLIKENR